MDGRKMNELSDLSQQLTIYLFILTLASWPTRFPPSLLLRMFLSAIAFYIIVSHLIAPEAMNLPCQSRTYGNEVMD